MMRNSWGEFSSLIRSLVSRREEPRRKMEASQARFCDREDFYLDDRPGSSTLVARFQIGERFIFLTHQQWEGDSDLLSEVQRREILRKTLLERIRKENSTFKM